MDNSVLQANQGLEQALTKLQAQVALQEKKLVLCLQMISEFSHFVPSIFKAFKYEMKKLDDDGAVNGNLDCLSLSDEQPTNHNKDGSISSED